MTKFLKNLFSMEITVVTLLLFGFSCAVATFIENDFGPQGSKAFIYSQTWFELLMLFLTTSIVFNIIWFKMYKKSKFFIFIIHFSIIFIFIGSVCTRYLGFEAIMTIPEGSLQNKMYSSDEYVQIKIDNTQYDKKVLMTELSSTNFSYKTKIDNEPIEIKFNRFVPYAIEKIVEDKKGKPILDILVSELNGTNNIKLKNKEIFENRFLSLSLNNKEINEKKPYAKFTTKQDNISFTSNLKTTIYTKDLKKYKEIEAFNNIVIQIGQLYKIGQTQFLINDASNKGILKIVSQKNHEKNNQNSLNAVIVDLIYNNHSEEIALYSQGGQNQGIIEKRNIQGHNIQLQWGAKEIILPFSILLDDFKLERYPGSNSPSSYSSDIKVYDKKNNHSFKYKIFMNKTLDYQGYRFFQSSYKKDESATILSVNKDPGKTITYLGYALLFLGLILSLFVKNSRFNKLKNKKFTLKNIKQTYYLKKATILFLGIFFACTQVSLEAKELTLEQKMILNIDKNHAKNFGELLIQDYQGRIKPINSLAIEILNKLTRKNSIYNLDANEFFLSMLIYPEIWQELRFIKIKDKKLKKFLNLKEKVLGFKDIYTKEGMYKLQTFVENANLKKPSKRDNFDKDIIKVDERLNIAYALFIGDFFKAFPKEKDTNNKWLNANEAKKINNQQSTQILDLMKKYYLELSKASRNNSSWEKANSTLIEIKKYQEKYADVKILPSIMKVKAEIFFNKYNIFDNLTLIYLILGFILLILVFMQIFKQKIKLKKFIKVFLVILFIAFILHSLGLALRWYISGHAPWSNGYESMIYISWAIIFSGIFFARSSSMALATSTILSGLTLFVAHLSWMEPQITTLAPVLKSYWLTIHVSVITASYGFLALSCLLGLISLILFSFANPKNENDSFFNILLHIKETNRINEMSMIAGLVLLIIGNFLGGIWANESWGRYWGWDPKETWTLVSIIIYSIIIHLKYIKNMLSSFLFASLSVLSYSCIIMTYFGVNYYLSGKHSYAAGDPVPIPTFVPISLVIILVVILFAYKNRKVI